MKNFILAAALKSPIIIQSQFTLDALLAAVLFDQIGDVDRAHAELKHYIHCEDGLFHASSAIVASSHREKISMIAGLRPTHDLTPDLFPSNNKGRMYRKLNLKRRRDFGNVKSDYQTTYTPSVSWIVCGDLDKIQELLPELPFIGKKRSQGFGQVSGWAAEDTDLDPLLDENHAPRRPIPDHLFKGDRDLPRQELAWKPAYWNPRHRADCYAPLTRKDT